MIQAKAMKEYPGISHGISHSRNAKGQPKQKKPVEAAAD